MQTITQLFPINAAGTDFRAGVLMLPDDFKTNPEKCPLIYFSHGSGEFGDGTVGTANKLYLNGSPLSQAQSGLLNNITCPVTGKVSRPAIFALQGLNGWCVPATQAIAGIKLMLAKYPMIDATGILATGLSAGAEVCFEMMGSPDAGMFAAGFPLSCAPSVSQSLVSWTGTIGRVLAMHGNKDVGTITDKSNSSKAVDAINAVKPCYAYYKEYNGGHDNWAAEFIPSFRQVLPVTANGTPVTKAMNAYEFWMMCRNTKVQFTASGTAAGAGGTNNIAMATKAIFTATTKDNTITLDGSASTGNNGIGSYAWSVTGPSKPGWPSGRSDGGGQPGVTVLNNMANGAYTVSLQVFDKSGGNDTAAAQIVTVGAVIPPVPVPPAPPVVAKALTGVNVELVGAALKATLSYTDSAGIISTEVKQ